MLGPTFAGGDRLSSAPRPAVVAAVAQEDSWSVGRLAAALVLPDDPDVVAASGDGREPGRRRVRREVNRRPTTIGSFVEHMTSAAGVLLGDNVHRRARGGDVGETGETAGAGGRGPGRHWVTRHRRARERDLSGRH